MPLFTYEAKGADGKKTSGMVEAADKGAATSDLKRKNLVVLSLLEQTSKKKKKGFDINNLFGPPKPRVKTKDIAVTTRQLATMVSAGIPLLESLEILMDGTTDPGFKRTLNTIIEKVRSGSDLSTALGEHPKIFSGIYVNMVKAGEAGGQLDGILNRLADFLENIEEIKREVKAAMTYPIISLFLVTSITVFLIAFIIPKFATIFEQLGMKELPAPTAFLLWLSFMMTSQWYFLVLILGVIGTAFYLYFYKTKRGQWQWHWFQFHMPVFGTLFQKVAISRFTRTFSTLIQSGVPMLQALDIVAGTAGNLLVEAAVLKAKDAVTKGEPLGEPLAATKVFPPMVTRMIAIGEKTGALEKLLSKVSEFYDAEVKAAVKSLTSLIEPLLIATMGFIVGGIVLSIFLPIIKIQQHLGGGS